MAGTWQPFTPDRRERGWNSGDVLGVAKDGVALPADIERLKVPRQLRARLHFDAAQIIEAAFFVEIVGRAKSQRADLPRYSAQVRTKTLPLPGDALHGLRRLAIVMRRIPGKDHWLAR